SDTSVLPKVHSHEGVKTLTEMPLVFHESRINLNITMRPIATGLSLRLFDVCGCGGFLLTNWQEELPELYEPGVEAEYFGSKEELLDKAGYYLEHDEERAEIARRGYERTKAEHTYDRRIAEMIRIVNGTI
ncbi:MAG: glycosyltransferase family 1 protein, partial [Lachnospiraceae bacterium]|nr:glycosyltransferase family 1 protein [Lachnospiraceae bacterium]